MPDFNINMPELSTIVAVLSVLAVPVATLIGVAVTQRNNRNGFAPIPRTVCL